MLERTGLETLMSGARHLGLELSPRELQQFSMYSPDAA